MFFKTTCYNKYKVIASISNDKKEFTFIYQRKNKENVFYKIIYNHDTKEIELLEKLLNNSLVLRIVGQAETDKEMISDELKSLIDDIVKNVEKR